MAVSNGSGQFDGRRPYPLRSRAGSQQIDRPGRLQAYGTFCGHGYSRPTNWMDGEAYQRRLIPVEVFMIHVGPKSSRKS